MSGFFKKLFNRIIGKTEVHNPPPLKPRDCRHRSRSPSPYRSRSPLPCRNPSSRSNRRQSPKRHR